MDDRKKKSIELVSDVTKQLVTVATALVAFVAGVLRTSFEHNNVPPEVRVALLLAILSVVCGLLSLLVLTGSVASKKIADAELTVYHWAIRWPAVLQLLLFVASLTVFVFVL